MLFRSLSSSSPTRLATMLLIVSGRSLNERNSVLIEVKKISSTIPEVTPYRIRDFVKEDTRRVDNPQALDSRHVLLKDELGLCSRVEQTLEVPIVRSSVFRKWKIERLKGDSQFSQRFDEVCTLIHAVQTVLRGNENKKVRRLEDDRLTLRS